MTQPRVPGTSVNYSKRKNSSLPPLSTKQLRQLKASLDRLNQTRPAVLIVIDNLVRHALMR